MLTLDCLGLYSPTSVSAVKSCLSLWYRSVPPVLFPREPTTISRLRWTWCGAAMFWLFVLVEAHMLDRGRKVATTSGTKLLIWELT
jgi:hypothetical protein